jgi:farnesyl-diphosphate farnesyltransferase
VDTVEDEPELDEREKDRFLKQFVGIVRDGESSEAFADVLHPRLSANTIPPEHDLIRKVPQVIQITRSFEPGQQRALAKCVQIMATGMSEFQQRENLRGVATMDQMDRYCYFVAGVVGEMLTELFCLHSEAIARRREELLSLAVSFGQGLQMTNILKDVWEDLGRGACWLPRSVFDQHGFDLATVDETPDRTGFVTAMDELVGIARGHLSNALRYVLLIPKYETGIRSFCLLALGMAALTLRKIHRCPDFTAGSQVKITRRSVGATLTATNVAVRQDWMLRSLFALSGRGVPFSPVHNAFKGCWGSTHPGMDLED